MDSGDHLAAVIRSHEDLNATQERQWDAIVSAVDAGVAQEELARATGISRVTLWRWLKAERTDA